MEHTPKSCDCHFGDDVGTADYDASFVMCKLHAAAPALLEALKQWLTHVEYWHQAGKSSEGRRCTDCTRLEVLARAAIKAAKGDA